jgi:CheY-like chemotaxis protein
MVIRLEPTTSRRALDDFLTPLTSKYGAASVGYICTHNDNQDPPEPVEGGNRSPSFIGFLQKPLRRCALFDLLAQRIQSLGHELALAGTSSNALITLQNLRERASCCGKVVDADAQTISAQWLSLNSNAFRTAPGTVSPNSEVSSQNDSSVNSPRLLLPNRSIGLPSPPSRRSEKKKSSTNQPTPNPHAPRVLVVEDNTINMRVASALLKHLGFTWHGVENGAEALKVLEKEAFDVILMVSLLSSLRKLLVQPSDFFDLLGGFFSPQDIQMPVMDGYEATMRIRLAEASQLAISGGLRQSSAARESVTPQSTQEYYESLGIVPSQEFSKVSSLNPKNPRPIPIIAVTAGGSGDSKVYLAKGFTGLVMKPLQPKAVLEILRTVIPHVSADSK